MPGARYFVTMCVQDRASVRMDPAHFLRLRVAIEELSVAGDWRLLAAVVMPDHLHGLFTLGER